MQARRHAHKRKTHRQTPLRDESYCGKLIVTGIYSWGETCGKPFIFVCVCVCVSTEEEEEPRVAMVAVWEETSEVQ